MLTDEIKANDEIVMEKLRNLAAKHPDIPFIQQIIIVIERAMEQRKETQRQLSRRENMIKRNFWK